MFIALGLLTCAITPLFLTLPTFSQCQNAFSCCSYDFSLLDSQVVGSACRFLLSSKLANSLHAEIYLPIFKLVDDASINSTVRLILQVVEEQKNLHRRCSAATLGVSSKVEWYQLIPGTKAVVSLLYQSVTVSFSAQSYRIWYIENI